MARFFSKVSATEHLARMFAGTQQPLNAMVEIADRCNETCVHCYQVQGQKGELSTEDWKRVFDELAEMGVLFLTISGGEATLRADFLELVAHARERRFAVKLYTNGLTMTDELAARLAELAVQEVQISVYSHRPEAHDWVTGVPGSWERTVAGVRSLRAHGLHVVIKTPLMVVNQEEMEEYIRFADGLGADYSIDPRMMGREDGTRDPHAVAPEARYVRDFQRRIRSEEGESGRSSPRRRRLSEKLCSACSSIHVEPNGELRPCNQLAVPIGHAVRDGVRKTNERDEAAAFIRSLSWADVHGCRICDLKDDCHRCHAESLSQVGDALRPYPGACSMALAKFRQRTGGEVEIRGVDPGAPPLGPFVRCADGGYTRTEDEETPWDRSVRERHPWIRRRVQNSPASAGGLVQLRRPGRKDAVTQAMPVPSRGLCE